MRLTDRHEHTLHTPPDAARGPYSGPTSTRGRRPMHWPNPANGRGRRAPQALYVRRIVRTWKALGCLW